MEIETHPTLPAEADLGAARAVYEAAFGQPPYEEPPTAGGEFVARVERYAATRDGFRLYLARSDGSVVGVVLAVVAHPGDWWREQVAAALGPSGTLEWLGDACVEVVHVAVTPERHSRGVGSALMATLHQDAVAPRGVLGVHPEARPAQRLYQRSGWEVVDPQLHLGSGPPSWLMGRRLP